jgi:hypothetical protein
MARATGRIAKSSRSLCKRSLMHTARVHTRNQIPPKRCRIPCLRNLQGKADFLELRASGTAALTAVIPVIDALFSVPYDPLACARSGEEGCSARESLCLIFVHVDVFVRMFDSQQRSQATRRTKLSLIVRTEGHREYGQCPPTSRRRQQFIGEAPGNHSGQ